MAAEAAELQASLERIAGRARRASWRRSTPQVLAHLRAASRNRRNGVAVAEARDGICTICHVRLRPQVFNNVLRNDQIIQCDSCNRILYFVPTAAAAAPAPDDGRRSRRSDHARSSSPTSTAAPAAIPGPPATASGSSRPTARSSRNSRESIGVATNNVAEYRGLLAALEWARTHGHRALHVRSDSLLLVQQMLGNYKVKNAGLQPLHAKARLLAHEIGRVTFEHVGRAHNAHADRLANAAMDRAE